MNQDFTVQKKQYLSEKKFVQRGSAEKKFLHKQWAKKKIVQAENSSTAEPGPVCEERGESTFYPELFFSSTAPKKKQLRSLSQFLALQLTVGSSLRIFFTVPKPVRVTQQYFFTRGGSAPRSNPLPFYKPFFTKKVTLSCTFYWQMVLLSHTLFRTLHSF